MIFNVKPQCFERDSFMTAIRNSLQVLTDVGVCVNSISTKTRTAPYKSLIFGWVLLSDILFVYAWRERVTTEVLTATAVSTIRFF